MLLNELSAAEAVKRIAAGDLTSEALVQACLDRIALREPAVHAWVCVEVEAALEQARRKDKQPVGGPLHGVPVGVKDVIDTCDMPTEMGSPIFRGYRPFADAACVAAVKAAGAIVLGKTVTAEFAYVAPGPTRNPHNLNHTPGGSSSGSAAAVADFMVPMAFGTQTGGSVIRPASYCGVVGFKPTYGSIARSGLKLAAESLDTIGLLARTVEDIALFNAVLSDKSATSIDSSELTPPRVGLCRTHLWPQAEPAAQSAVAAAARALSAAGAHVVDFELPAAVQELSTKRTIINNVERADAGAWEWHNHRSRLSRQLAECIAGGLTASRTDYRNALRLAERCRLDLDAALRGFSTLR